MSERPAGPDPLTAQAARAWRFRCGVEQEAEARFARLAGWLRQAGLPGPLSDLCLRSSSDERRHARLCAELARRHGGEPPPPAQGPPPALAPAGLPAPAVLLYEAVAACCVTETGSVGVLTALLGAVRGGALRRTLRTLAADEVRHSQLGWAILALERERGTAALLSPFVPAMLAASVEPELFHPGFAEEPAELLELGVLPRSLRREVFTRTATEVVLPGLEAGGVDVEPARRWLREQLLGTEAPPEMTPAGASR